MTSVDHNVLTNATGILTVSSRKKKESLPSAAHNQSKSLELELELNYLDTMVQEIETMDPYEQHMSAYVALCTEERFIQYTKQQKFKCIKCADELLTANDKINDEFLAMKTQEAGKSEQPSASTLKIVIFANAVMKMVDTQNYQENNFNEVWKTILANIDIDDLYENSDFKHDEHEIRDCKEEFVSLIIKTYMTMKSHAVGKKITDEKRGEIIRFRRKRNVILAGQ